MTTPAIEFHDVAMHFRVPHRPVPTLKEWAIQRLKRQLRYEVRAALHGVSFELAQGEALGVIGANGAGKSTLLRVAAGILTPSVGEAVVRGRVAPIIELGTGFDTELSGRENVFFNGALLGRSRVEMLTRFGEIVDFSGLADSIDAPLRTYSTGMVARLAFAIATAVDADILLLDEILAVGDENFRRRCRRRIDQFRGQGATIILVSHDLETIDRFCSRALLLEHGGVVTAGATQEVVARYRSEIRGGAPAPGGAGTQTDLVRPPGWRCSRSGVAVGLVHAVHGSDFVPPLARGIFSDVPDDHPDAPYVELLTRDHVVAGFPDGTFRPDQKITRAEFAVLLTKARLGGRFVVPSAQGAFTDVPPHHWAAGFIEQLLRDGIAGPYDDGSFLPDIPISERDVELLLERAFD